MLYGPSSICYGPWKSFRGPYTMLCCPQNMFYVYRTNCMCHRTWSTVYAKSSMVLHDPQNMFYGSYGMLHGTPWSTAYLIGTIEHVLWSMETVLCTIQHVALSTDHVLRYSIWNDCMHDRTYSIVLTKSCMVLHGPQNMLYGSSSRCYRRWKLFYGTYNMFRCRQNMFYELSNALSEP